MNLAPCVWFVEPAESDPYVAEFYDITRSLEDLTQAWQDLPADDKARALRRAYHLAHGPRSGYIFPEVNWNGLTWKQPPQTDMCRGLALFAFELLAEPARLAELDAINRGVVERALGPDRERYDAAALNVCGELVAGIWARYRKTPEPGDAFAFVGGPA